jgi:hypothetical protein
VYLESNKKPVLWWKNLKTHLRLFAAQEQNANLRFVEWAPNPDPTSTPKIKKKMENN